MKNATWKRWFRPVLDLCFNSNCPLCQRSTAQEVCLDCERQLQQCRWTDLQPLAEGWPVLAWGRYDGALRRAIATLKYNNTPQLARPLGRWLGQCWQTYAASVALPALTVVPIPMHPEKQKSRGFNQAELIAEAFCQHTQLPLEREGLLRVRATEAQFGLSAGARADNLANAFAVGEVLLNRRSPKSILLVDDIYTTGATAHSAAQTLRRAGIRVYGMVVVARTMRQEG